MTRETKVGVAVACSFLGLVAAVVVLRLGGGVNLATDNQVVQVRPNAPAPAPPGPAAKSGEPGVLRAINFQQSDPVLPPTASPPANQAQAGQQNAGGVPQAPPPVTPPDPITPPPPAPRPAVPAREPKKDNQSEKPAVVSPDKSPPVVADPIESAVPPLPSTINVPPPPAVVVDKRKPTPPDDDQKKLEELARQAALAGQEKAPAQAPPISDIAGKAAPKEKATEKAPEKTTLAQSNDLLPPAPVPAQAPLANSGTATPPAPVPAPPGNAAPPAPAIPDNPIKAPTPPAPADVSLKLPKDPIEPPAPPSSLAPKPAQPPAVVMGPKTSDSLPGELFRQKDPLAEMATPKPAPAAPLGAPPAASSAPIPVPMPPASGPSNAPATVRSWDTVSSAVKPGESSFADLSRRLYNSEKYAQPLLLYNREYNPAAEDLRADPPRLKPGLPIFVPPTYILEQPRYAAAPAAPKPAAVPTTPVAPPSVVLAPRPPAPAAPIPPVALTTPLPKTPNTPENTAGSRSYLVRGNGEMLFEIARQTLGDGKRWSEIYRLNPDIRPELAIPGGTQLRLPADARVGS